MSRLVWKRESTKDAWGFKTTLHMTRPARFVISQSSLHGWILEKHKGPNQPELIELGKYKKLSDAKQAAEQIYETEKPLPKIKKVTIKRLSELDKRVLGIANNAYPDRTVYNDATERKGAKRLAGAGYLKIESVGTFAGQEEIRARLTEKGKRVWDKYRTKPTKPAKLAKPAKPAMPAMPAKPAELTELAKFARLGRLKPIEPIEPAEPAEPINLALGMKSAFTDGQIGVHFPQALTVAKKAMKVKRLPKSFGPRIKASWQQGRDEYIKVHGPVKRGRKAEPAKPTKPAKPLSAQAQKL